MNILELILKPFGPFRDQRLVLGPGLHVLYGPNEAGKSSTLKALRVLFYGSCTDEFNYGGGESRVQAELQSLSGERQVFVRRTGRKDTLTDLERRVVEMSAFTRDVSEKAFTEFFGIDWPQLQAGSQTLLDEQGELSRSLFSASFGGQELPRLQKDLESQAEALFSPRKKHGINALSAQYKELEKELRDSSTSPESFQKLDKQLQRQRQLGNSARQQQQSNGQQRAALTRQQEARRLLDELSVYRQELDDLGSLPELPSDCSERRGKAQETRRRADEELALLETQIGSLDRNLEALFVDEPLLEWEGPIQQLYAQHQQIGKDLRSLPIREAELAGLSRESERMHSELGLGQSLPAPLQRNRWRSLSQQWLKQRDELRTLQEDADGRRLKVREDRQRLATLGERVDASGLKLALESVPREGESSLDAARLHVRRLGQQLHQTFSRLPLCTDQQLSDLLVYQAPLPSQLQEFSQRFEALELQRALWTGRRDERSARLEQFRRDLAGLGERELPSLDELQQARQERHQSWLDVRQAWLEGSHQGELPELFEQRVQTADALADRLLESGDLHHRRQLLLSQIEAEERELELSDGLLLQRDESQLRREWSALWQPLEPASAAVMQDWLIRRNELLQVHQQLQAAEEQLSHLEQQLDESRSLLIRATRSQQLPEFRTPRERWSGGSSVAVATSTRVAVELPQTTLKRLEAPSLNELAATARQALLSLEQTEQKRLQLENNLQIWESDLQGAEHRFQQLCLAHERTTTELAALVQQHGLPEVSAEEVQSVLDQIAELDRKLQELQRCQADCRETRERLERFAAQLRPRLSEAQLSLPSDHAVAALHIRLVQAVQARDRQAQWGEQLEAARANQARHQRALEGAQVELERLLELAGCPEEQLPQLEQRVSRARQLGALICDKTRHIERLQPGVSLHEIGHWQLADLEARDEDLKLEGEQLQSRGDEARDAAGGLANQLAELQDREGGAGALQQLESLRNRIHAESQRYLRLKLALGVLQKQIERYARERHEPLLSGTGRIFAQLTGGRFAGVLPGRGAKDQPILVGERADGSSLPVEKMSQGTRDQLFLSLRLATLEHWIERKGAFPLVVDDLCVHFDDQRAGAALEVLAGLGQRSQVLYFTHLQRDLDLGDRLAARGLATCHRM